MIFGMQIYRAIADREIPLTVIGGRVQKGHRLLANNTISKIMRSAMTKIFTVDQASAELLHEKGVTHAGVPATQDSIEYYPSLLLLWISHLPH